MAWSWQHTPSPGLVGSLAASILLHTALLSYAPGPSGAVDRPADRHAVLVVVSTARTVAEQESRARVRAERTRIPSPEKTTAVEAVHDERSAPEPAPELAEAPSKTEGTASDFASPLGARLYYPNRLLQRQPKPISAPNPKKYLTGLDFPAMPLRLRLFIGDTGTVDDVSVSSTSAYSAAQIEAITAMFRATSFIPGRLEQRDVPCYMDIEINLVDIPRGPQRTAVPS